MRPLTVAYRGNFQPDLPAGVTPWSTEYHVAASLELLGHQVVRIQENTCSWPDTVTAAQGADLFLWTQTYGYAQNWARDDEVAGLAALNAAMPTAGLHLDLWWGLEREHQIRDLPYFQELGWVFTADGDHDEQFAQAGVHHHWSPPAVFGPECTPGTPRSTFRSDVAFVGSWRGGYHDAWWPQRKAMLDIVAQRYRQRARFWPRAGAVRGRNLNDLYASVKVVVGDSCFADTSDRYFTDRPFETVGRGGFLVMPWIRGLAELLIDGEHCRYYPPGDFPEMKRLIDHYLVHDDERERIRQAGQAHVAQNHTYANRCEALLNTVFSEIPAPV
jgi:hypothetical protein